MFKSLIAMFTRTSTTPAPTQAVSRLESCIKRMSYSFLLPVNYFESFTLENFNVTLDNFRYQDGFASYDCPLFNCVTAWHADVTPELRYELLADDRHKQIILHVFSRQDRASLLCGLEKMGTHGYWRPMAAMIQGVLDLGWYGAAARTEFDAEVGGLKLVYKTPTKAQIEQLDSWCDLTL